MIKFPHIRLTLKKLLPFHSVTSEDRRLMLIGGISPPKCEEVTERRLVLYSPGVSF